MTEDKQGNRIKLVTVRCPEALWLRGKRLQGTQIKFLNDAFLEGFRLVVERAERSDKNGR